MSMYQKDDKKRLYDVDAKDGSPDFEYRSPIRRDYARILHSASFRRLEGKTQLFPGQESDFFRNRLTHSLEVAQIAKDIAFHINHHSGLDEDRGIDPAICEIAGLVHDLGHPPFGHNGERALDDCMKSCGGFEGNAQTLRILLRTEKKERIKAGGLPLVIDKGFDKRLGLNLTSRVIASALKYDTEIPFERRKSDKLIKGYYRSEKPEIERVKINVLGRVQNDFKTVECMIMDIADDIAYSTYDLEDAFKVGFLTIYDIMSASHNIINYIEEKLREEHKRGEFSSDYSPDDIRKVLVEIFGYNLGIIAEKQKALPLDDNYVEASIVNFVDSYEASNNLTHDGYLRNAFTSQLVQRFISGIEFTYDESDACLSKVKLAEKTRLEVSILKHFAYASLINSSKLKIAEFRGYEIVESIFKVLANFDRDGYRLLPEDFQALYLNIEESHRKRIVCDFIAGMTDRYALEFFGRLYSENPETIFKPF